MAHCGDKIVDSGEECDGGDLCSPDCKILKAAAPLITADNGGVSGLAIFAIALAGFGSVAVAAYVLRKQLHLVVAHVAGEKVAQSLDDVPLDQIEMPWQKW
jgi:hypothetical protein